jgi:site-specific DNA-methyltransferase (adenine-specific)
MEQIYNCKLYHGDCLFESDEIESGTVDLILTDLPYGTIKNLGDSVTINHGMKDKVKWDDVIDCNKIMNIANRILRKNGKMVLFAQQPFTTKLINAEIPNLPFNYSMIWKKDHFANSLIAKKAPVNYYEDILVFSKTYDLEGIHPLRKYFKSVMDFIGLNLKQINNVLGHRKSEHTFYVKSTLIKEIGQSVDHATRIGSTQFSLCTKKTYYELIDKFKIHQMDNFKTYDELLEIDSTFKSTFKSTFNLWEGNKYKSNILKYKKDYDGLHPTQKPILLLEDLIKTFSNKGNLVVDLTMGSGSTGVACVNTNRNFIGIEKDEKYFNIAVERIKNTKRSINEFF